MRGAPVTRATDRSASSKHGRRRALQTVVGIAMIAAGAAIFLLQPEHASGLAIFFVGIGGGLVEPGTVIGVIRALRSGNGGGGYGSGSSDSDTPESS